METFGNNWRNSWIFSDRKVFLSFSNTSWPGKALYNSPFKKTSCILRFCNAQNVKMIVEINYNFCGLNEPLIIAFQSGPTRLTFSFYFAFLCGLCLLHECVPYIYNSRKGTVNWTRSISLHSWVTLEQVKSVYPYEIAVTVVCSRLCLKRRKMQWKDRCKHKIFSRMIS